MKYLTPDEAAFMAKVSRSMITVWYQRGFFPAVKVGTNVRIKRKEFEEWLKKEIQEGAVRLWHQSEKETESLM